MRQLAYSILALILISCSAEECDCKECEEKLKTIQMNAVLPIDLPEDKTISVKSEENQLTVIVLENNTYPFEGSEYDWDNLLPVLKNKIEELSFKVRAIKIAGHKFAHYESVFSVLAFCQANELDPVLAYDK